jgi:DNA-binding response OmpR family regulator
MTRILLCEDSRDVRHLLEHELSVLGVEIVASSGTCAGCEEHARDAGVDAIVLDLTIADGDMDVIRRLSEVAPVVVFSGWPAWSREQQCLDAGAAVYVEKLASPEELATAIRAAAASRSS